MSIFESKEAPQQSLQNLVFPRTISGTSLAKYEPIVTTETLYNGSDLTVRQHCITLMEVYRNKSLEELRAEDYARRQTEEYVRLKAAVAGRARLNAVDDRLSVVEHKLILRPSRAEVSALHRTVLELKSRLTAREVAGTESERARQQQYDKMLECLERLLDTTTQRTARAVGQLLETTAADSTKVRLDELEHRIDAAAHERKALARATDELHRRGDAREQEAAMIDADVMARLGGADKRLDALEARTGESAGWGAACRVALLGSLGCNAVLLGALLYRSYRK